MLGAPKVLRAARISVPIATVAALAGCFRTEVLVQKFNDGVVETGTGDPKHSYESLRKETAYRRIYPELIDGYFGEGGPEILKVGICPMTDMCPQAKPPKRRVLDRSPATCVAAGDVCRAVKEGPEGSHAAFCSAALDAMDARSVRRAGATRSRRCCSASARKRPRTCSNESVSSS